MCPVEPSEVTLMVDGKTDLCSRQIDINFNHIGFSLYGQVLYYVPGYHPNPVSVNSLPSLNITHKRKLHLVYKSVLCVGCKYSYYFECVYARLNI